MPPVPLGTGAYRRDDAFEPPVELYNLLMEKDGSGATVDGFFRIQRWGLDPFSVVSSPVNGVFQQDGVFGGGVFAVGGGGIFTVSQNAANFLGFVAGNGIASFAPSGEGLLFVLRYPYLHVTDGASVGQLTFPDGGHGVDIDQINGYIIALTDSGRFYWLEPGTVEIQPLNFATAESSPDGGIAVKRLVDELFFFGKTTIEVWQVTGDQDAPFQRAPGRIYDKGCLNKDTVQRFDNSLIWVGNDLVVYRASQVPQDIGSPFLSERLRRRTGEPSSLVIRQDDHELYVLRIPGQGSYAYDASTQEWSEFGSSSETEWRPITASEGGGYLGDSQTGSIWRYADTPLDDGQAFERRLTGNLPNVGRPVRNDSFSLSMGAASDVTVRIDWRDGREDFPAYSEDVEVRAPTDVVNIYRLGQMREPFRVFRVRVDAPVKVRIAGATYGEAWQ